MVGLGWVGRDIDIPSTIPRPERRIGTRARSAGSIPWVSYSAPRGVLSCCLLVGGRVGGLIYAGVVLRESPMMESVQRSWKLDLCISTETYRSCLRGLQSICECLDAEDVGYLVDQRLSLARGSGLRAELGQLGL